MSKELFLESVMLLRSVMLWLILLLPAVPAFAGSAPAPVVLIVGDSLSAGFGLGPGEGWVTLLEQKLDAEGYPHRVVNASISGDTTRGALSRLPRALDVHDPEIVVLELGGNDGLRGFPPEVMRKNLAELIRLSRDSKARVLLLGMHLPANYGADYTERFHKVFVDLSTSLQVPFLPFFLEGVALAPGMMQDDGIHPNAGAQAKMLENVWPALEPLLETQAAASSAGAR